MTFHALSRIFFLIGSASACVYVVSRGVDAWLKLPMEGRTIEKYEELYRQKITLRPSLLWKRGLLVFLGTVIANGIITLSLYVTGWLTVPIQQNLKSFWFFTVLFSLPFSEITY